MSQNQYDAILLDADETLFNFRLAEQTALKATLCGLTPDLERACALFHDINASCWREFEKKLITQPQLQLRRFDLLCRAMSLQASAPQLSQVYVALLAEQSFLLPDALHVCQQLALHRPLALVTNGIARVQRRRLSLSPLERFFRAIVISEEVGAQKPDPRMIFAALERLGGIAPHRALMVGDSLFSDMAAGLAAGCDTCWYNPNHLPRDERSGAITYEIHSLPDVLPIALGQIPS